MKLNDKKPSRPPASEAAIREMHDRAAGHGATAAQHETAALRIVAEAESAAESMRRDAAARAEEHRQNARKMAADHIAGAEAEAARLIAQAKALATQRVAQADAEAEEKERGLQKDADENLAEAHRLAQQERDHKAAEERDRDYWASLASFEAAAAGLSPVTQTLTDGLPGTGEVAGNA